MIEHSFIFKMPRTKEQYNEIRSRRKVQIMDSALELFANEGYGHVSITMLSKHAGISKGLMYNYFPSKEALLKEILSRGFEEVMKSFDPNQDGIMTPDEFKIFIHKTFSLMLEKREFFIKFLSVIIQPNVKALLKNSALLDFLKIYYKVLLAYFKKQGFEDPFMEIFHLSALMEGFGMMMLYYNDLTAFPREYVKKLEDRIIKTYT